MDIIISKAVQSDIKFIDHLQRKNAEELAFYPKVTFEREIESRRILLARVNGTPAGYLYFGAFGTTCKIHQACIEYDLRGQLYGSELVKFFISLCQGANVLSVTLRCGSDVRANTFWQLVGFYCEHIGIGGVRRMRDINCWRRDLQQGLFDPFVVIPSNKKKSSTIWSRRESSAASSIFVRGRAMKEYRELIVREAAERLT